MAHGSDGTMRMKAEPMKIKTSLSAAGLMGVLQERLYGEGVIGVIYIMPKIAPPRFQYGTPNWEMRAPILPDDTLRAFYKVYLGMQMEFDLRE